MAESSRKGRSISRKACDLCRERKIQCQFNNDISSAICQRCFKANVPCTFLTDRKPRGPPSKRVAEARQRAAAELNSTSPPTSGPSPAPAGPHQLVISAPSVSHFVPEHTLNIIIDDFFDRVYPVLPLVHVPSFTEAFAARRYEADPAFLRLCIALCAATIASIPRRISVYGSPWYRDVGEMIDRAAQLIHLSRLTTETMWFRQPTMDTMIVSVIMSLAAHYAGRECLGYTYAAEAISYLRAMELYKKKSYADMNRVDTELCKRSFWIMFFMQMHDRISHYMPHTGMSYDPFLADWDFLMPLELSDDELASDAPVQRSTTSHSVDRTTPMISGFIALVKVFLSVADLLHKAFPGAPPGYQLSSGAWEINLFHEYERRRGHVPGSSIMLDSLFQVMSRLNSTLGDLPEALRMPRRRGSPSSPGSEGTSLPQISPQFDIMRANIHITAIYIQSTILETCTSNITQRRTEQHQAANTALTPGSYSSSSRDQPTTPDVPAQEQLWELREAIARELLDVVRSNSSWTLESNGMSMIIKIREIASTLLERSEVAGPQSDAERRSREYITQFVEILADLDYAPRAHVAAV